MIEPKAHVHDCTGPTMTCSCGFKFTVPPILVSIEVVDRDQELVNEAFNCDHIDTAISALRNAISQLENRRRR